MPRRLLERANGGTILLDSLPAPRGHVHARLLTMLESRSVFPQGAERARKLNLRIIMAIKIARGEAGDGVEDPFEHRLGAVRIRVPSLALRRADLAELFRHFVGVHERDLGIEAPEIGEAAFYGPKADFVVTDWIGREWQLGTVQLDYNLPSEDRFALEYIGADNSAHRPVMIHRAPLGSMERFVSRI